MITQEQLQAHAAWIADGMPDGDGRRIVARRADLRDADLEDANLVGANLEGAYLGGAYLVGANLTGANLESASLAGACLGGATLRGANLHGANLESASLAGACLGGADLYGADLVGADLESAYGITSAGPVGRNRRMIYAVDHGDRVMIRAACRWDTAEAVVAAIEADYADAPAMRDAYIMTVRAMVATLEAAR